MSKQYLWWILPWLFVQLSLPWSSCCEAQLYQGEKGIMAETTNYRVELAECVDSAKPRRRECAIEIIYIKSGEQRLVRFGREYLSTRYWFTGMRIVGDTLVMLTEGHVIVFDLKKNEDIKYFLAVSASFLPDRDVVLFNEWELRRMSPDVSGRVISILDLNTLRRRPIFPETEKLFEFPISPASDPRLEPFLRSREEDPALRCQASRNYWSPGNSKFAFMCAYSLSETAYMPGVEGPSGVDVVVIFLPPDIASSTFKRFKVYDKLYKKDVEIDLQKGWSSIDKLRWLSNDVLEIVAKRRDWLHSGATINVVTDEFLLKD